MALSWISHGALKALSWLTHGSHGSLIVSVGVECSARPVSDPGVEHRPLRMSRRGKPRIIEQQNICPRRRRVHQPSQGKCVAGTCGTWLEQRVRVDQVDRIGLDILRTCVLGYSWIRLPSVSLKCNCSHLLLAVAGESQGLALSAETRALPPGAPSASSSRAA